jgi:hypothetical protein
MHEVPEKLLDDYGRADYAVRTWVEQAIDVLADDDTAIARAGRQAAALSGISRRAAEADVRRTAARVRRLLHRRFPAAAIRASARIGA